LRDHNRRWKKNNRCEPPWVDRSSNS
jgi:hypothetical protein